MFLRSSNFQRIVSNNAGKHQLSVLDFNIFSAVPTFSEKEIPPTLRPWSQTLQGCSKDG